MRSFPVVVSLLVALVCVLVTPAEAAENAAASMSKKLTVRSLQDGGMVMVQQDYHDTFGDSTLTATKAVTFSPRGASWSPAVLENVVIEGGDLNQPVFMPRATLRTSAEGERMLVGHSIFAGHQGVVVTWTCTDGTLYANGVSTGKGSMCLGANTVVKCGTNGDYVWVIRTKSACAMN